MTIHIPSLFYGALAVAVLYTFFPVLAEKPSAWLRSFWTWAKKHIRPNPAGEG